MILSHCWAAVTDGLLGFWISPGGVAGNQAVGAVSVASNDAPIDILACPSSACFFNSMVPFSVQPAMSYYPQVE